MFVTGVLVLSAIVNQFRLDKIVTVDKFVMAYGGLRGAVAFALVLLIDPHHVPQQQMFLTTTIAVIYFTVFVQVCEGLMTLIVAEAEIVRGGTITPEYRIL